MAHVTAVPGVEIGLVDRIATAIAGLRERVQRYKLYRQTVAELGALSDRELGDLGLHRSWIRSIARNAAYGS